MVTTYKLAISTACPSETNPNVLNSDSPDIPGAASATSNLFSGGTIRKIDLNLVADDLNKNRKPTKCHVIVSDDSDSE